MGFIEYERTTNLFVQAMKGTSLGAALRKVNADRWGVLVPHSAKLEELGLGVISHEFLNTHTVIFDAPVAGAADTFTTVNGLRGCFATSTKSCDTITIQLPAKDGEANQEVTPTPLGPAVSECAEDAPHPLQGGGAVDAHRAIEELLLGSAAPAPAAHADPTAASTSAAPAATQNIHILRQTELEVDQTDGFTVPIYLVSDAVRAMWVSNDPLETAGWVDQPTQEPRDGAAGNAAAAAGNSTVGGITIGSLGGGSSSVPTSAREDGASVPAQPPTSAADAARPKFHYRNFQEQLLKHAPDIKRKIKAFVNDVNNGEKETVVDGERLPLNEEAMPDVVRAFLAAMFEDVQHHPKSPWRDGSEQDLDFAQEGLEKCVLTKIYEKTFGMREELDQDKQLESRLATFKNVEPQALEVSPAVLEHPTWAEAVRELQKVNGYKCARDKLISITNCCKLIMNVLRALDPGKAMSADDFLPCLILLVCKADARHLFSNTAFIEKYRNSSKMTSLAGYYFCTLQSAIHYLMTVDETSMCFTPEDLEKMKEDADLANKDQPDFDDLDIEEGGENARDQLGHSSVTPDPALSPGPDFTWDTSTPQVVRSKGDAMKADVSTILRGTTPANAALLNRDLKAGDLKDLCDEYHRLATLYASMLELVHANTAGPPPFPTAPAASAPPSAPPSARTT